MSKFNELLSLNVNKYTEKKKNLTYLTWSFAWQEFKKVYPDATYEIEKDEQGRCYFGDENIGYMCYTKITADGLTYEMWLPVMDAQNKSMKLAPYTYTTKNGDRSVEAISAFDINKTIMRCLVKNMAMFGLGLYIYSGEDLPETLCPKCGAAVMAVRGKDGNVRTPEQVLKELGGMCLDCYKKHNTKTTEEK